MIERQSAHRDKTYVLWEDFSRDGTRIADSHVCAGSRCTNLESGPFVSHGSTQISAFSICGEEGFAPLDAKIAASEGESSVHIEQPTTLVASVSTMRLNHNGNMLQVHINAASVDRALIWAGNVNRKTGAVNMVYWNSEESNVELNIDPQGIDVRIPPPQIQVCQWDPDCEIVVQLVKYWNAADPVLISATEYRATLDFRNL